MVPPLELLPLPSSVIVGVARRRDRRKSGGGGVSFEVPGLRTSYGISWAAEDGGGGELCTLLVFLLYMRQRTSHVMSHRKIRPMGPLPLPSSVPVAERSAEGSGGGRWRRRRNVVVSCCGTEEGGRGRRGVNSTINRRGIVRMCLPGYCRCAVAAGIHRNDLFYARAC